MSVRASKCCPSTPCRHRHCPLTQVRKATTVLNRGSHKYHAFRECASCHSVSIVACILPRYQPRKLGSPSMAMYGMDHANEEPSDDHDIAIRIFVPRASAMIHRISILVARNWSSHAFVVPYSPVSASKTMIKEPCIAPPRPSCDGTSYHLSPPHSINTIWRPLRRKTQNVCR
jgi:hypothetical protein